MLQPLPPLPENVISVTVLLCERVLNEKDGVLSVIRLVDTFEIDQEHLPPEGQRPPILMHVLILAKFLPSQGGTTHAVQLKIVRPDGQVTDVGAVTSGSTPSGKGDASVGVNVIVPLGVIPNQFGMHYVECVLDGQTVARMPFTLRLVPPLPTVA